MIKKLSNKELAELVADALLRAKILDAKNLNKATQIITEEITARKAIGDF